MIYNMYTLYISSSSSFAHMQECLNIFGGSGGSSGGGGGGGGGMGQDSQTALKMCYAGHGHPLTLL